MAAKLFLTGGSTRGPAGSGKSSGEPLVTSPGSPSDPPAELPAEPLRGPLVRRPSAPQLPPVLPAALPLEQPEEPPVKPLEESPGEPSEKSPARPSAPEPALPLLSVSEPMDDDCPRFVTTADGELEEHWEFDEGMYTLCMVSVMKRGLLHGFGPIVLATLPAIIQVIAFCRIFMNLIPGPEDEVEDSEAVLGFSVKFICFLLMAAQLSNEAIEGFQKVAFSLRVFSGLYQDVNGPAFVGFVFGSLQLSIAVGTVGLSMLVVSQQITAMDAFMNFVAVGFLTEVDNIILESKTVRNFLSVQTELVMRRQKADGEGQKPVCLGQLCWCNGFVGIALFWSWAIYDAATMKRDPEARPEWSQQIPSVVLAFATMNLALWAGTRVLNNELIPLLISIVSLAFIGMDTIYLYSLHRRLLPSLTVLVLFWFALIAPTTSVASAHNPFPYLECPIKTPGLVWLSLVYAVFALDTMYRFGV